MDASENSPRYLSAQTLKAAAVKSASPSVPQPNPREAQYGRRQLTNPADQSVGGFAGGLANLGLRRPAAGEAVKTER